MFARVVGNTVKRLRKDRKMSQEELAEIINSHQVYISEIERGLKTPSLPVLYDMAKAFGMSLTELISIVEKEYNSTNPC